jgi:hypothetical protein
VNLHPHKGLYAVFLSPLLLVCATLFLGFTFLIILLESMVRLIRLPRALRYWVERRWLRRRSTSLHGKALSEDSEGLLDQEKGCAVQPAIRLIRLRRCIALVGVSVLVILLLIAYQSRSRPHLPSRRNTQTLHLLIPTSNLDPELCKTVLSAEILHYSTPTLVQWDAVAGDGLANGQRRTTAVRDYLGKLKEHHENDTVILLDSASTWFQLRPEVLLKRYYGIVNEGNRRLAARVGVEAIQEEGIEQSVVFTASSTCGATEDRCSQITESPLIHEASRNAAPRYLDQGMAIGPVKGLYEIYRRTVAIIERTEDLHMSELAVFSEIFGNQEHHRGMIQPKTKSWSQRFHDLCGSYAHGSLARKNTERPHNGNDFGIGLDYTGELAFSTASMSESYTWVEHATMPQDIQSSMPPFWTTTGQGLPSEKAWSDLTLFTNSHTHAIPAAVHHHSDLTNNQYARQQLWQQFWLSQFSRKLFDASTAVPTMPLAAVVDHENVEQIFWSTTIGKKAGVKWSNGTWVGWNDLCKGEQLANEIFGDGLGEWTSPAL